MKYRQITVQDRRKIAKLKSYKLSISEIARRTGFNKSTISRELKRNGFLDNSGKFWSYIARYANNSASNSRKRSVQRKRVSFAIDEWIVQKLLEDWTPEHIAGRSSFECSQKISHEYVYKLILRDKKKGGRLYRRLKRFGKRRQRFGSRDYTATFIPERRSIADRPKIANDRKRMGDLEGDLIVGYKQSGYILTVLDRKTRLVALELLPTRKKNVVARAFLKAFKRMPDVKTLTLDNAREFSCHLELKKKVGVQVFFADPYCSYQRGSVENINGWIRHYFPKKYDFKQLLPKDLRRVEKKLNTRPRKVLRYLTPEELAFTNKEPCDQTCVALRS